MKGDSLFCIEIKSGQTFPEEFFILYHMVEQAQNRRSGACVYGGNKSFKVDKIKIHTWKDLPHLS
jgi:hypothetical protein